MSPAFYLLNGAGRQFRSIGKVLLRELEPVAEQFDLAGTPEELLSGSEGLIFCSAREG
jgi:hypothetical protein